MEKNNDSIDRQNNHQQLRNIAQPSPMLQIETFKQQLQAYWRKTSENQSDENKQRKFTKGSYQKDSEKVLGRRSNRLAFTRSG